MCAAVFLTMHRALSSTAPFLRSRREKARLYIKLAKMREQTSAASRQLQGSSADVREDEAGSEDPTAAEGANNGTWYIIPCPSEVRLSDVKKERGTHGSIYTLWECELRSPLWVGQSIPALVRSINDNVVHTREKRLHASSLYRCLRGEARKLVHKSWKVEKFSRTDLDQLNRHIGAFPSVIYVSKSPEMWRLGEVEEDNVKHRNPGPLQPNVAFDSDDFYRFQQESGGADHDDNDVVVLPPTPLLVHTSGLRAASRNSQWCPLLDREQQPAAAEASSPCGTGASSPS